MRSHAKNILAGVGTGAVVILLGVLSIMSFANVNSSGTAQLTIIKHVVPPSTHNINNHRDIEFDFEVYKVRSTGNIFAFRETLDDDGVDADPNYLEPKSKTVYAGYSPGLHIIKEIPVKDIYNTSWECYYDNHPDEGRIHGFGTETYSTLGLGVELVENDPMTCEFTNVLADATLKITKDIQPDSRDKVDFDIFTRNDNEHSNGYDYFFLGDNETHTTKMVSGVEYGVSEYSGARVSSPQFAPKYTTNIVCTSSIPSKSFTINGKSYFGFDANLNGSGYVFDSGETLDCVFTNIKNPEIVVKKVVDPVPGNNDEHFNFSIGFVGLTNNLGEFTLRHGEETNPAYYVDPSRQYNIKELLKSDQINKYRVSAHCDIYDASGGFLTSDDKEIPAIEVALGPSEKAICTFTNHLLDVELKKVVLDKDGTEITNYSDTFKFETNLPPNSLYLSANNPSSGKLYFNTVDGIEFKELLTREQSFGYETSYECIDNNDNQLAQSTGTEVNLSGSIVKGKYGITCTFINKQLPDAYVFVHKLFVPEDTDDVSRVRVFPFGKPVGTDTKEIIHDHNQVWEVRPGDITIHEIIIEQNHNNPEKNYTQKFVCDFLPPSTRASITVDGPKLDIPGLKSEERVQCTLTNKEVDAVVKIKKDVVGSNGVDLTEDKGVFNFTSTLPAPNNTFNLDDNPNLADPSELTFSLVPNNTYDFTEVNVPNGYTVSVKCVDDKTGNTLKTGTDKIEGLKLDKFQSATCTFTNTKAVATIIIAKDVVGKDDDTNIFKIESNTSADKFELDDNPNQAPDSSKTILVPAGGTYTFDEKLTPQQASDYITTWKCTDRLNSNGSGTTFTTLPIGTNESMTCTFINTIVKTTITIIKDVKDEDGKDITNDPEVFKINNSTDFYDLKPLDDNQGDPTYPNQDTIDVTPGKQYFFLEKLQGDQKTNYTPSWECKLGNTVIGNPSGAAILDIPVKKGDHIICVITNVKKIFRQNVTIRKVTNTPTAGEVFVFSATSLSNQLIRLTTDSTGTASKLFKVKAGSVHNIKELATNNKFPVTSYTCSYIPTDLNHKPFSGNGKIIPTFTVPKGYDVECTFTNCTNGIICPAIADPHDPDPNGGGTSVVGGGGSSGGGNQ